MDGRAHIGCVRGGQSFTAGLVGHWQGMALASCGADTLVVATWFILCEMELGFRV